MIKITLNQLITMKSDETEKIKIQPDYKGGGGRREFRCD